MRLACKIIIGMITIIFPNTYVLNNPLKYINPSGNYCVSFDIRYSHNGNCNSSTSLWIPDTLHMATKIKDSETFMDDITGVSDMRTLVVMIVK